MDFFRKTKAQVIVLVIVASVSFFFWNRNIWQFKNFISDAGYYDRVAQSFVAGNGFFDKGEFQNAALGYEFFLVSVYKIFGHSINNVRLAQGAIFLLTIILLYALARQLIAQKIAFIAALFSAVFYVLPLSAAVVGKESLSTFLVVAFIFSLIKWFELRRWPFTFSAAFSIGYLALTLPVTKFLIIPTTIIFLIFEYRNLKNRQTLISCLIFGATFMITISPLYVMNLAYNDSLGFADQGGGLYAKAEQMENVYADYPAHLLGISLGYYFSEQIFSHVNPHAFRDVPKTDARLRDWESRGVPESVFGPILFTEGKAQIFNNPHKYALMSLLDFISLNSPLIPHGDESQLNFIHLTFAEDRHAELSPILRAGYILFIRSTWYLFLLLAVYGIVGMWKQKRRETSVFLGVVFYWWLVYSLVHALPRYAIPLYPIYSLFAFFGVYLIYIKLHEKTRRTHPGI